MSDNVLQEKRLWDKKETAVVKSAQVLIFPTKWCFTTNFENLQHPFQKYLEKGHGRSLNGGCTKMIYGHFIAELPGIIVAKFKNASDHISFCIMRETNHVYDGEHQCPDIWID